MKSEVGLLNPIAKHRSYTSSHTLTHKAVDLELKSSETLPDGLKEQGI